MTAMMACRPARTNAIDRAKSVDRRVNLEHLAHDAVARHTHFRGRADRFEFVQQDDVLVVRGSVPSFYLKQLLQTALKELDGVRWVINQVDVVACDGLSSVSRGQAA